MATTGERIDGEDENQAEDDKRNSEIEQASLGHGLPSSMIAGTRIPASDVSTWQIF